MLKPTIVAAACLLGGLVASEEAFAQGPVLNDGFERNSAAVVLEGMLSSPEAFASPRTSAWETVAIGAVVGAVMAGTAAYVFYPHVTDPWLTRGQHTALITVEGALIGGGIGALVALINRRVSESKSESSGGG